MSTAPAKCSVCQKKFSFNNFKRYPYTLRKCGHSFCAECMADITQPIDTQIINCPFCQVAIGVTGTESGKYVCVVNSSLRDILDQPPSATWCLKCGDEYGPENEPYFIGIHSRRKECGHSACLSCISEMRDEFKRIDCEKCGTYVKLPGKTVAPIRNVALVEAIEHAKSTSTPEAWKKNTLKFLKQEHKSFKKLLSALGHILARYVLGFSENAFGRLFVAMIERLQFYIHNETEEFHVVSLKDRIILTTHYPKPDLIRRISRDEYLSNRMFIKILTLQARLDDFMDFRMWPGLPACYSHMRVRRQE